ncbi:MAG: ATP-binding protein [Deltaproteobacteria bacterium]|nr:ATP-binding protein [Deltaproteobacteria bacterium]
MISRLITLPNYYSFFLFGPRGSGKSTLLRKTFQGMPNLLWLDLLDTEQEARFQSHPGELLNLTASLKPKSWVVIDEVQKAPKLLDLVHKLIEEKGLLFALSGSSARKLKRGAANLLAGRAFIFHLYPYTSIELASTFDLSQIMHWGALPKVSEFQNENDKKLFLQAYANTYLKEEIQMEQIVRNLPSFRKFLDAAAQMNGLPLNYSKIGMDIDTDHSGVKNFFEILEDTLIGFRLPTYDTSFRKQQRQAPKFYFFDCGIKRALNHLLDIPLKPKTYEFGRAFEHFFILELYKLCAYRNRDETLSYLQTKDNLEIDLIISRPGKSTIFLEIKSTAHITEQDASSLRKFTKDIQNKVSIIVSLDAQSKSFDFVQAYHWQAFICLFLEEKI